MSSPLARTAISRVSKALIGGHRKLSHTNRTQILATLLGTTIARLTEAPTCLDIGCGDMTIAEMVAVSAPRSTWRCLDLYSLPPDLINNEKWDKYIQFDGRKLPFEDQTVDVALFCDVLHHMPTDAQAQMVSEAARVAKYIVVKDHFEYGILSRTMLRAMDFFGNWAYGVSVPKRYFCQTEFLELMAKSGLQVDSLSVGVDLYGHLPVIRHILRKEWQFIALISHAP